MAKVELKNSGITVKLSFWEKLGSLRGDLFIPVTSLRGASSERGQGYAGTRWARLASLGIRCPGTYIPGLAIYGTYRGKNKDFVAWKRGQQVLQLTLSGKPYSRVFVGVEDAAALADQINDALTSC